MIGFYLRRKSYFAFSVVMSYEPEPLENLNPVNSEWPIDDDDNDIHSYGMYFNDPES